MTQETTPGYQEVEGGINEAEAASEILKRMGVGSEPPAEETQSTEETPAEEAQEATTEAEETTEEAPEESEEVEIDVAGEKYKLPAALQEQAKTIEAKVKEIEAGATRKFQEAAELRKVAEAQTEAAKAISQVSEQELDLLANQRTINARLQQIMSLDINALAEDPVTLTKLNAEAMRLQAANQQIEDALKQTRAQKQEKTQAAEAARMSHLQDWAAKNIKGFNETYSQTLLEFSVKELGADPQALRGMLSEPVLKALDLAYKGWKVQTTDPKAKQVTATKTLRPGATGQAKTSAQQAAETANRRFAQTKKVDDAAAAILARMNAKRR
jgi:hypothetical protein